MESLAPPEARAGAVAPPSGIATEPGGPGWLTVPFALVRLLFPVMIITAMFLLLRGHDLPGGGFSAGMVVAAAVIVQYMIGGTAWIEDRLVWIRPIQWIGGGLLIASLTGLAALGFGRPFLTTYFAYADWPILGRFPTASALLFDIGIFILVVGATLLILVALAHQSARGRRGASMPSATSRVPSGAPRAPAPDRRASSEEVA